MTSDLSKIVVRLLAWWEKNKRNFPWRSTKDPYRILVAEILLRKTDAPKVLAIYEDFFKKYPSIKELAEASEVGLAEFLKPLGLYRVRAKQLKNIAKEISEKYKGIIPQDPESLKKLKGIGSYIANAVACFAHGKTVPVVDTNVARVISRVFGIKPKARPHLDKRIWRVADELVKLGDARKINLAIIDLATLVCTARQPNCKICPLKEHCAYAKGWRP